MVVQKYKKVTHSVSKDLASYVLRTIKDSGGDVTKAEVYSVFLHKDTDAVVIVGYSSSNWETLNHKGYVSLLDTSSINKLVASREDLRYKTSLEKILYKALKTEEYRVKEHKANKAI